MVHSRREDVERMAQQWVSRGQRAYEAYQAVGGGGGAWQGLDAEERLRWHAVADSLGRYRDAARQGALVRQVEVLARLQAQGWRQTDLIARFREQVPMRKAHVSSWVHGRLLAPARTRALLEALAMSGTRGKEGHGA